MVKSGLLCEKWLKVVKGGGKLEKVGKSREKLGKVEKSG